MRLLMLFALLMLSGCADEKPVPVNSAYDPEAATGYQHKAGVSAEREMVAAATPAAAKAGADILAAGGNAIDAAIAVQSMLTLTEPQSSGLGGGGFLLYWDAAERKLYTIDARETAPHQATPELFLDAHGKPPASFMAAV